MYSSLCHMRQKDKAASLTRPPSRRIVACVCELFHLLDAWEPADSLLPCIVRNMFCACADSDQEQKPSQTAPPHICRL